MLPSISQSNILQFDNKYVNKSLSNPPVLHCHRMITFSTPLLSIISPRSTCILDIKDPPKINQLNKCINLIYNGPNEFSLYITVTYLDEPILKYKFNAYNTITLLNTSNNYTRILIKSDENTFDDYILLFRFDTCSNSLEAMYESLSNTLNDLVKQFNGKIPITYDHIPIDVTIKPNFSKVYNEHVVYKNFAILDPNTKICVSNTKYNVYIKSSNKCIKMKYKVNENKDNNHKISTDTIDIEIIENKIMDNSSKVNKCKNSENSYEIYNLSKTLRHFYILNNHTIIDYPILLDLVVPYHQNGTLLSELVRILYIMFIGGGSWYGNDGGSVNDGGSINGGVNWCGSGVGGTGDCPIGTVFNNAQICLDI